MKNKLQEFYVVGVLVSLLMSSASFAVTKWACVGDSITAGWKLKEADTYCYKLGVLLGAEYETMNFGHSARTMLSNPVEGWPYWDSPMFTESKAYLPDIVSIMLGTNDAHPNNWPELSAEYYQDAFDMVREYQGLSSNPRVILMTIPPAKEGNSRNLAILEVNTALQGVAGDTNCELADVWQAIESSGLSERQKFRDPIHLNGPAHTVIAELLYDHFMGGGPSCGDGSCDLPEDKCSCPDDCIGLPDQEVCTDGVDNDCDALTDCEDSDCDGAPDCQVGPVIFSDDFESGDFSGGDWTTSGNAQVHEQASYTGTYGVKLQKVGAAIELAVSTVGRAGILVEYDRMTVNFESGSDSFDVEWFDGEDWHVIESTDDSMWGHFLNGLPAAADNNPNFRIRFTGNVNHPIEKAYLDNVKISD